MIDRITADWNVPFDLDDLLHTYDLSLKDCSRYTLVTKKSMKNMAVSLSMNDRGWQSRFVFFNKEWLGEVGGFLVEDWTEEGKSLVFVFCY